MSRQLTAIIQREGDGFVAFCPEVDVASQGDTIEQARDNLREALELFFECASPTEVEQRLAGGGLVTQGEVTVGETAPALGPGGLRDPEATRGLASTATRQPHRHA